jgi:hypothetical protein
MALNQLHYDPDFNASAPVFSQVRGYTATSVEQLRQDASAMEHLPPLPDEIIRAKISFWSHDGATICMERFTTKDLAEAPFPTPAVV